MTLNATVRLALFVLLLLPMALLGWRYGPALGNYLLAAESSTTVDADIDNRSIVYRLSKDRPLTFVFSQPVDLVRALSQSSVTPDERANPKGFVYSLELRLFDGANSEIARHELILHSDAPDTVFASGENWRFFRNRSELVAGLDDVVVQSPRPAVRSEWRILETDPAIQSVDIRIYERRPALDSQALAAFRRRSDEEKLKLSDANAFPPDMLTPEEMTSIAANMWRPVGPVGIAGRDYQALVLYEGTRRETLLAREP